MNKILFISSKPLLSLILCFCAIAFFFIKQGFGTYVQNFPYFDPRIQTFY
jgi:hypothetical protein